MARPTHITRHWLAALVGVVALLAVGLGAGAAYGYFTSSGSGSGSATTGTMSTVTVVTATTSPTQPLLPGGSAGDVVLKVNNPNNFSVSLTGAVFKAGGTITFDASHSGCSTTDSNPVVILNVPSGDLPQTIQANQSRSFDLPNSITMDAAATNNCEGATINIPVTITVHSS